jgi:hypothetical protein
VSDLPKVCAVCAWPLATEERSDGTTVWFHLRDDLLDHPPIAVDWHDVEAKGRCDFCDAEELAWVVLAESFTLPHLDGHGSRGPWAACERCGSLVKANAWSALVTQAAVAARGRGQRVPRQLFVDLYSRLQVHVRGSFRMTSGYGQRDNA